MWNECELKELIGKTCISVENLGDAELIFKCDDGTAYKLHHYQNCCESVTIDDITGDLQTLVGNPILVSEEASDEYGDGSFTWTFYKFGTNQGWVDVRWYGSSNGYYSESVSFEKIA